MKDLEKLLGEAGIGRQGDATAEARGRLAPILSEDRAFPQGFWDPQDEAAAVDVISGCLEDLGVAAEALPREVVRKALKGFATLEDGQSARRHQIGVVCRHVNQFLRARKQSRNFHAFAEDLPGWESNEPVWLLLTAGERERLLERGILSPPQGLEQQYDPTFEART